MKSKLVGTTHVVAGGEETLADVIGFLEFVGIETRGNPDVYVRAYRRFGIDEARSLRERASLRALGERRVFVIATAHMNREAQNALLKVLEEPPGNAIFIIVVPSPEALLPTLRSRLQTLDLGADFVSPKDLRSPNIRILDFLKAAPQKRLDMLKPLLEKGEDDKRDLGAILSFLASLECVLGTKPDREGISAIYRARKYVTDKGALVKPLLEQLALLVPRV